ncbi:uncharacterized protein [Palaemon carinicauda]|uniref:uncharacterized protein n=1 Tax=Palaemon carinicauda TaxID=392227 RepID=UPI0035B6337C
MKTDGKMGPHQKDGKIGRRLKDGKIGRRQWESGCKILISSSAANAKLNQLTWASPEDRPIRSHPKKQVGQFAPKHQSQNDGRHFDLGREQAHVGWTSTHCSSLVDLARWFHLFLMIPYHRLIYLLYHCKVDFYVVVTIQSQILSSQSPFRKLRFLHSKFSVMKTDGKMGPHQKDGKIGRRLKDGKIGRRLKDGKIGRRQWESGCRILINASAANAKLNQLTWASSQDRPIRSHPKKQVGQFAPKHQSQNDGRHFDSAREQAHVGWTSTHCSSLVDLASISQRKDLKTDSFGRWYIRSTRDPWRNGRVRFRCTGY